MSVHLRVPTRACLECDAYVHGHARGHLLRTFGCAAAVVPQDGAAKLKVTPVGFEPTRIAPPELESGALDHSAKVSCQAGALSSVRFFRAPPCADAAHQCCQGRVLASPMAWHLLQAAKDMGATLIEPCPLASPRCRLVSAALQITHVAHQDAWHASSTAPCRSRKRAACSQPRPDPHPPARCAWQALVTCPSRHPR